MWLLFYLFFSQLFPPQNAAPSTRHGVCSTAHQRRLAELPQLLQHRRQVVHRDERPAVLGAPQALVGVQASAPQRLGLREGAASSTWASLSRGSPREPKSSHGSVERGHFFHYLWCRGIFLDPSPWWETRFWDSICFDFT